MVFSKKKPQFLKTAKFSQFDAEFDWNSKSSQNFQKLGFFAEKDGFSEKKHWNFQKWLEVLILLYNATERVKSLKAFKICFFKENRWVSGISGKKMLNFFVKCIKVANLSQNRLE